MSGDPHDAIDGVGVPFPKRTYSYAMRLKVRISGFRGLLNIYSVFTYITNE